MTDSARIAIPGTWNFRRAGATVDEALLAPGRLFRSDSIDAIGDEGRATFVELGVSTVIDLRSRQEIAAHPDDVDGIDVDDVHLPIFAGSAADFASLDAAEVNLSTVYAFITERSGDTVAQALRTLSQSQGATLVHCTAGKDRTGVVVALALTVAGASRDEIAADYAWSETLLAGEWAEQFTARAKKLGWAVQGPYADLAFRSPESAIRELLARLEVRHGSIDGYLDHIGFGADDRETLRASLAAPVAARVD